MILNLEKVLIAVAVILKGFAIIRNPNKELIDFN